MGEATTKKPTCATCNDTHRMLRHKDNGDELEVMCTGCPVPCGMPPCGAGAYCKTTPCGCGCHTKSAPDASTCATCNDHGDIGGYTGQTAESFGDERLPTENNCDRCGLNRWLDDGLSCDRCRIEYLTAERDALAKKVAELEAERDNLQADVKTLIGQRDGRLDVLTLCLEGILPRGAKDSPNAADTAIRALHARVAGLERIGPREPTQKEVDDASGGRDDFFFERFGTTVRKCRHCDCWVFGGPTACVVCVETEGVRRERDALAAKVAELEAEQDEAWAATGVSVVRGMTSLADVIAVHRRDRDAATARAEVLAAERDAYALAVLKNSGIDTTCGVCMAVAFAGSGPHGEHTCVSPTDECLIPPPGWRCTRGKHTDGPCAAIPDTTPPADLTQHPAYRAGVEASADWCDDVSGVPGWVSGQLRTTLLEAK